MEYVKRIDLGDVQEGAYAVVRQEVPYGFARAARKLGQEDMADRLDLYLRSVVKEWSIRDVDGKPVPPPEQLTVEILDTIPASIVARLVPSQQVPQEAEDPNSSGGASSASS